MNKTAIRSEIEKLILWLLPLIVLSAVAEGISKAAFSKMASLSNGTDISSSSFLSLIPQEYSFGELMLILQWAQHIPKLLISVVIAIWLYNQAKKIAGRKWLWAIAGLCMSYWAIGLYLFSLLLSTDRNVADNSSSHNV